MTDDPQFECNMTALLSGLAVILVGVFLVLLATHWVMNSGN